MKITTLVGFAMMAFLWVVPTAHADDNSGCELPAQIHIERTGADIQSASDLQPMQSELDKVFMHAPDDVRATFIDSLTFNERGLTGYNYRVLLDYLSESEINTLMSLFGFSNVGTNLLGHSTTMDGGVITLPGDGNDPPGFRGYHCLSPETCARTDSDMICTANC
ncbi:MAG: hypothetical protein JJU03_13465 [Idiomarina sp.]|nr:hypothetical protein [Idiomarina sp.]